MKSFRAKPSGLIGGIGMTEVAVYAQRPSPDGTCSGCPHVHAVTDEGYFVLEGTGRVEFHDLMHGFRTLPLRPGDYIHFQPLILHRLISDGDLKILGMMGNAGLAEQGDARIYFGPEVDGDSLRFDELVSVPKKLGLEGALTRRDESVKGYQHLLALWKENRDAYFAELKRYFETHLKAMKANARIFQERIKNGPSAWAGQSSERIDRLPLSAGESGEVLIHRREGETALGMCGVLRPILSLSPLG